LSKVALAYRAGKGSTMVKIFEDLQQVSKENVEVAMKSAETLSKAIACAAMRPLELSVP